MLAVHRTSGLSLRVGRAIIDVIVVTIGWFLGGPLGFGTVDLRCIDWSLCTMGVQVAVKGAGT